MPSLLPRHCCWLILVAGVHFDLIECDIIFSPHEIYGVFFFFLVHPHFTHPCQSCYKDNTILNSISNENFSFPFISYILFCLFRFFFQRKRISNYESFSSSSSYFFAHLLAADVIFLVHFKNYIAADHINIFNRIYTFIVCL